MMVYASMLLELSKTQGSDDDNQDVKESAYRMGKDLGIEIKKMKIGEE